MGEGTSAYLFLNTFQDVLMEIGGPVLLEIAHLLLWVEN